MSVVTVEDVTVRFGDATILESISCAIERGEFVGLVGPNGAGKSTLLRTMSGAITPATGTVTVDDIVVHDVRSRVASQRVATVPQDTNLSFSFPVRDVVAMGRYPHRSRFTPPDPRDRERVANALERTATDHLADRRIDEVSGGERQRVLLARAIAQDTPVMLLDEPTASLDVNHQVETLELIAECARDGTAVVAAIHDLDLAARYCDRLLLIAGGRIRHDGPPEAVLTSETIGDAFDATAIVAPNPVTGTESVTTIASSSATLPSPVHVCGTGPLAARALAAVGTTGATVTAGPLVAGSVAAETADRLDAETVELEPFAPIEQDAVDAVGALIDDAAVTVVAGLQPALQTDSLLAVLAGASSLVVVEDGSDEDPEHAFDHAHRCRPTGIERAVHRAASAGHSLPADDD